MSQNISVEFHILENANHIQALHYACQQIEKSYSTVSPIYIHMETEDDAKRLDALLWTFREDSFLPHDLYQTDKPNTAPIQIGFKDNAASNSKLLVNLSKHLPNHNEPNSRIIEIVFSDPNMQQLARERFKHYRDQGHDIITHKLKTI